MNILDPQGPVAAADKMILIDSIAIMLAIVVPTIVAIFAFAWYFRASNTSAFYWPDWEYSGRLELVVWSIPALTVILLGGVAWIGAHQLDPAKPVAGDGAGHHHPGRCRSTGSGCSSIPTSASRRSTARPCRSARPCISSSPRRA